MKLLLELRPALDGHAGIPQETRLLFRGLRMIEGLDVEGMIIHSGRVLAKGLPADPAYASHRQVQTVKSTSFRAPSFHCKKACTRDC